MCGNEHSNGTVDAVEAHIMPNKAMIAQVRGIAMVYDNARGSVLVVAV